MIRVHRWAAGVLTLALASVGACSLDLGPTPFACTDGETCPDGYVCVATECVAEGSKLDASRPMRVTFVNSAEMYWFASPKGGATLVVNDGFSAGALGLYEIHVAEDGVVSGPTQLVAFEGASPTSTAIVALDDQHYGALAMSFPGVDATTTDVRFYAIEREARGHAPAVGALYEQSLPYVGGAEPAYVAAVVKDGTLVTALTDPAGGGRVAIEVRGLDGSPIDAFDFQLTDDVLPLSGDCLLWSSDSGKLRLRLGLDVIHLFDIDLVARTATPIADAEGVPLYAFDDSVLWLETSDDGTATYVVRDLAGAEITRSEPSAFTDGLEPYTGVSSMGGALLAPISASGDFATLDVALATDGTAPSVVASFPRTPGDALYSARAFSTGGRVYLAWTSFHDSLMDVWVSTKPVNGA